MAASTRTEKPRLQIDLDVAFKKDNELRVERERAGHEFDMKLLEAVQRQRAKKKQR